MREGGRVSIGRLKLFPKDRCVMDKDIDSMKSTITFCGESVTIFLPSRILKVKFFSIMGSRT
jgi:hypothetical protein